METRPHQPSASNADFPQLPDAPRRRPAAPKRKASSAAPSPSPSKRLAKDRAVPSSFFPPLHNGPVTRARQSPSKLAFLDHSRAREPAPAAGDATANPADAAALLPDGPDAGKEEPFVDPEFEAVRSRGSGVHVVPTHAGWFQWRKVHPLEELGLASFFDGKIEDRTPGGYLDIRDAIVGKFHACPQVQIEAKDLEEMPGGDFESRQEVLEFLDHWGLVNFHPNLPGDSDDNGLEVDGEAKILEANGEAKNHEANGKTKDSEVDRVVKDFSMLEKLYGFDVSQSLATSSSVSKKMGSSVAVAQPQLVVESKSKASEEVVRPAEPSVEYHCNACSGDCSRKRYHCQKQADFDLCTECYNAEKFGQGMAASDFILMDSAVGHGGSVGSWTDQETLLLLEALEIFGANWNEIAEHVATKTKAQCILHFIQMPIEDPFLDDFDDSKSVDPGNKNQTTEDMETDTSDIPKPAHGKSSENGELSTPPQKNGTILEGCYKEADAKKISNDIVSDALAKAFQAVSSFPQEEGCLSFADSGNPAMALAAFIAEIVEPDLAIISTKSSLKAIYEDSPGIQLATRHCFTLEDPPTDNDGHMNNSKSSLASDSEVVQEENHLQIDNGSEATKKSPDTDTGNIVKFQKEDTQHIEKDLPISSKEGFEAPGASESNCLVVAEKSEPIDTVNKECNTANRGECSIAKLSVDADGSKKLTKDLSSQEEGTSSPSIKETEGITKENKMKPEDDHANIDSAEVKTSTVEDVVYGTAGDVNELEPAIISHSVNVEEAKIPIVEDMPCITAADEKDLEQTVLSHAVDAEKNEASDEVEKEKNVSPDEEGKDGKPIDDCHRNGFKKIKRAAVTALASAAVKAKILARQEEDQIRQLASMVIGKQLHKLEMKLALLNDVDGVIMRVREQLDRARKKLFHERTQIIAARYGVSTSSRPLQGALPTRFAAVHASAGPRQPNASSQKPHMTKP